MNILLSPSPFAISLPLPACFGLTWEQGAGHNDVEMYTQYLERLKQFVSVELVN